MSVNSIQPPYADGPRSPVTLSEGLAPATAMPATGLTYKEIVRIQNASKLRVRVGLTLTAATLAVKFLRPDGVTPYTQGQPAAVPLVAASETSNDFTSGGEGFAEISLLQTGAVAGSVGFVDVCQSR